LSTSNQSLLPLCFLNKADVWTYENREGFGRDTLTLSRLTGETISFSTRFEENPGSGEFIQVDLEDIELTAYDKPEDVPKARLTDEEKEKCLVMDTSENFAACGEDSDDLIQAAKDAFAAQWQTTSTGLLQQGDDLSFSLYPDTGKDYELIGSEEEQEKVNGLKSFLPGMVGRGMVPVRNQGNCNSCYSFAASHTISSSYAQEHPDSEFLLFSNQHFMNCLPLGVAPELDSNNEVQKYIPVDIGTGCWLGNGRAVINMVVYKGGKLPLIEEQPYIGFQSQCNLDGTNWVDTGKDLCVYDVYVKLLIYYPRLIQILIVVLPVLSLSYSY
jgi:hypothetical protein